MGKVFKKELGETDIKYGIFTGIKLDLTPGEKICMMFNGRVQEGHVHKTAKGRIDRMTTLIREVGFQVGDTIIIEDGGRDADSYHHLTITAHFTKGELESMAEAGDEGDESLLFSSFNMEEKAPAEVNPTTKNNQSIKLEGVPFGITIPKQSTGSRLFMPPYSPQVFACSNEEYIIIKRTYVSTFFVICKQTYTAQVIPSDSITYIGDKKRKPDNFNINAMAMTTASCGGEVYFAIDNCLYKWDIKKNTLVFEMALREPNYFTSLATVLTDVYYIAENWGNDGESCHTTIGSLSGLKKKYNRSFGKFWGEIKISDGTYVREALLIQDANCLELKGASFHILDTMESENGALYSVKDILCHKNRKILLTNGMVKIFNYHQETNERPVFENNNRPYYSSNYFFTLDGTCLFVSDNAYKFALKKREMETTPIAHTTGSCVPESFLMIDEYTAFVKISEVQWTIFDFRTGMKYDIQMRKEY